jgi:hypothetical protein
MNELGGGGGLWRVWGGEVCTGFWLGNLRERDQWGRPRPRWKANIKTDLQEVGGCCGDLIYLKKP